MAPQQKDKPSLKGLHSSLAKERSSGAGTSTHGVGCSLESSVRKLRLRMRRVFSRKTGQASGAFTMVSMEKHAAQAGDPNARVVGSGLRVPGQILQPWVERSVVIEGLNVVLLGFGEDVEGKPAGERRARQAPTAGQQHRRHDGVAEQLQRIVVRVVLVIVRKGVGAASPH